MERVEQTQQRTVRAGVELPSRIQDEYFIEMAAREADGIPLQSWDEYVATLAMQASATNRQKRMARR